MPTEIPSKEAIVAARHRISHHVFRTPLLNSPELDALLGCQVWIKCENKQLTGAFKIRGAINAVLSLNDEEASKGVITHSSGNHAGALAAAAGIKGVSSYVVMPHTAPVFKTDKVKGLGAIVRFSENTPEDREKVALEWQKETGATFIHPFDNEHVICGQASVAAEMLEQNPTLQIIIPPVGGGGLLSGSALSAHYFSEGNCQIIAAEPEGAADAVKSFASGEVEKADFVNTLADGLQTHLSKRTLGIIKKYVSGIDVVKEASIPRAMKLIHRFFGMYVEPSAAVSLALIIDRPGRFSGLSVGVILTGGNIDPAVADKLISEDE